MVLSRLREFALLAVLLGLPQVLAAAQQVIDRAVARVEDEIVLQSDVDQLARYQVLLNGKAEPNEQILDRLIDQWIVRKEAEVARFPTASDVDVERTLDRISRAFATKEDFATQVKKAGLSERELRQIVAAQTYLSNYLDSRFRPAVQIEDTAIKEFYETAVIARAKARGQQPPTFEAARDAIQEALIQRGIDEQADKWLKESRARLSIAKLRIEGAR